MRIDNQRVTVKYMAIVDLRKIMVDLYPQWLNLGSLVESPANTYTEKEVTTPVVQDLGQGGKALVMEMLKMVHQMPIPIATLDADAAQVFKSSIHNQTRSAVAEVSSSDYVSYAESSAGQAFPEATETGGAGWAADSVIHDDQAMGGKGPLYGKRSIFYGVSSTAQAAARTYQARLLYRLVKVSASELIGIIQN